MSLFLPPRPLPGDSAYHRAMEETGELVERMREASRSPDPVRAIMADLWLQRHNVPYVVTLYEAAQEMRAPLEQTSHK